MAVDLVPMHDPGVVDQDVDRAARALDRLEGGVYLGLVGEVAPHRQGVEISADPLEIGGGPREQCEAVPRGGESPGTGLADASTRTGDQDDAPRIAVHR